MGKATKLVLPLLAILTLSSCSKLNVYTVTEVTNNHLQVTDGKLFYNYTDELSAGYKMLGTVHSIQDLESFSDDYTLVNIDLSKYSGTLQDAVGYRNYMLKQGFTTVDLLYRYNYLDTLLTNEDNDEIRIIYLGNDIVRVFYKNNKNLFIFPPYINRKEGEVNG